VRDRLFRRQSTNSYRNVGPRHSPRGLFPRSGLVSWIGSRFLASLGFDLDGRSRAEPAMRGSSPTGLPWRGGGPCQPLGLCTRTCSLLGARGLRALEKNIDKQRFDEHLERYLKRPDIRPAPDRGTG